MTVLYNYKPQVKDIWTGRTDDLKDPDGFRMHQIIQLIDLNDPGPISTEQDKITICLIGFCCDEGIIRNLGRPGAKDGPEYIRREFANLPVRYPLKLSIFDAGNIICQGDDLEAYLSDLAKAVENILQRNMFPVVLGGGHEIALGNYSGISQFLSYKMDKTDLGIINFDAHFDLRPYENQASSGNMFSRISDMCVEQKKSFNYLCLGIQTSANTNSLFKKAQKLGVRYILAKDFKKENFTDISDTIRKFTEEHSHLHVTICTDVFNSAIAPGVSSTQPFGADPEVMLQFLKQIIRSNKMIGVDIAEVSPRFDHDNRTAKLVAVMIYAIINTLIEIK